MLKIKNKKRILIITLPILAVALVVVGVLGVSQRGPFAPRKLVSGTIPSTNPASAATQTKPADTSTKDSSAASSGSQTAAANDQPADNPKQNTGPANPNAVLVQPSGSFVSNHRPSLSNQSAESSVCTTTAGASCYIQLTNGAIVKKLDAQTVDASGTTYWNWGLKQAGVTSGSWKVQAIATLGSQSQTATDPIMLEVQP